MGVNTYEYYVFVGGFAEETNNDMEICFVHMRCVCVMRRGETTVSFCLRWLHS